MHDLAYAGSRTELGRACGSQSPSVGVPAAPLGPAAPSGRMAVRGAARGAARPHAARLSGGQACPMFTGDSWASLRVSTASLWPADSSACLGCV